MTLLDVLDAADRIAHPAALLLIVVATFLGGAVYGHSTPREVRRWLIAATVVVVLDLALVIAIRVLS